MGRKLHLSVGGNPDPAVSQLPTILLHSSSGPVIDWIHVLWRVVLDSYLYFTSKDHERHVQHVLEKTVIQGNICGCVVVFEPKKHCRKPLIFQEFCWALHKVVQLSGLKLVEECWFSNFGWKFSFCDVYLLCFLYFSTYFCKNALFMSTLLLSTKVSRKSYLSYIYLFFSPQSRSDFCRVISRSH